MHITFSTYLSCIHRIATSNFSCILWHIKNYQDKLGSFYKAERVGFEPTRPLGQTVFKTASLWPLRYLSIYLFVCRFRITSATRCILSQLFTVVNTFFKLFCRKIQVFANLRTVRKNLSFHSCLVPNSFANYMWSFINFTASSSSFWVSAADFSAESVTALT